jgi:hypothetical protein
MRSTCNKQCTRPPAPHHIFYVIRQPASSGGTERAKEPRAAGRSGHSNPTGTQNECPFLAGAAALRLSARSSLGEPRAVVSGAASSKSAIWSEGSPPLAGSTASRSLRLEPWRPDGADQMAPSTCCTRRPPGSHRSQRGQGRAWGRAGLLQVRLAQGSTRGTGHTWCRVRSGGHRSPGEDGPPRWAPEKSAKTSSAPAVAVTGHAVSFPAP